MHCYSGTFYIKIRMCLGHPWNDWTGYVYYLNSWTSMFRWFILSLAMARVCLLTQNFIIMLKYTSTGSFPVTVDFNRFAPGNHTLLLTVQSAGSGSATHQVAFVVPEPLSKFPCF